MKRIDLSQTIGILANVGVVAGIIFLVVELRQNNDLLAAQARYNLIVQRADMNDTLREPYVLEALQDSANGVDLQFAQSIALLGVAAKLIEMWEWQYNEYRAGMLERGQLPVENWRVWYHGELGITLPVREAWETRRTIVSADFARFMEENVVNR